MNSRRIFITLGILFWVVTPILSFHIFDFNFGGDLLMTIIIMFVPMISFQIFLKWALGDDHLWTNCSYMWFFPAILFKKITYKTIKNMYFYSFDSDVHIYKFYWIFYKRVEIIKKVKGVEHVRNQMKISLDSIIKNEEIQKEREAKNTSIDDQINKWSGIVDKSVERDQTIDDVLK